MGVCNGTAVLDNCDSCYGGTSPISGPMFIDCFGVCNGTGAYLNGVCTSYEVVILLCNVTLQPCPSSSCARDDCGDCYGPAPCQEVKPNKHMDCNSVCNGTSYYDTCGKCVGGTTKNKPCKDNTVDDDTTGTSGMTSSSAFWIATSGVGCMYMTCSLDL